MKITRHFVNVADRRVHYRKAGRGPPLLMVHQSPRSSAELEPLMKKWAEHFTCIAPDTPGFGQSTPLEGDPSINEFADAIVAFLDAAGLPEVAAYGFHSGGIILVTALRRHPQRFSALAIGGYGIWTEQERAMFGDAYLPPFTPRPYGDHLTWLWNRVLEQTWFFPWFDTRPQARMKIAHADPIRVDGAIREMLDSGDAYRSGYGAVLDAESDIPGPDEQTRPVLITAFNGDPLQSHLARLGDLPADWQAHPVETPQAHHEASLAFLLERVPSANAVPHEARDEGFAHIGAEGFDGLIHWRGDRTASRVLLHAPGGSSELLNDRNALTIDLPGHGLSDQMPAAAGISAWSGVVAAAVKTLCPGSTPIIAGQGFSALLALSVAAEIGSVAEGFEAHVPLKEAEGDWLAWQPNPMPDRFGNYLSKGWSAVRAAQFFWPWFRSDAEHAIPFTPEDIAPERLALLHRSLFRARSARDLMQALFAADRSALAAAVTVGRWNVAEWAVDHPGMWRPDGVKQVA